MNDLTDEEKKMLRQILTCYIGMMTYMLRGGEHIPFECDREENLEPYELANEKTFCQDLRAKLK